MAIANPYYPTSYTGYPVAPYPQPVYPQQIMPQPVAQQPVIPQPVAQTQQQQIQNGGFVNVRSIEEVNGYPLAPGNSVTFFVESNPPVLCVKTKGFSQLETPTIETFDLIKREQQNAPIAPTQTIQQPMPEYALKSDLEGLRSAVVAEISEIHSEIDSITPKKTPAKQKKEAETDAADA